MKKLFISISILVLIVIVWGLVVGNRSMQLTNDLQEQLIHSANFEILSLNHVRILDSDKSSTNVETLLGYPILGRVKIDDQNLRKELISAVSEDIARANHSPTACVLEPRHGIRCVDGSNSVLIAICYECGDVLLEQNGKNEDYLIKMGGGLRSPTSKQLFDKMFKEAGIKTDVK